MRHSKLNSSESETMVIDKQEVEEITFFCNGKIKVDKIGRHVKVCGAEDVSVTLIKELIQKCKKLKKFSIVNLSNKSKIHDRAFYEIMQALNYSIVKELVINHSELSIVNLNYLKFLLTNSETIKALDLSSNELNDFDIDFILEKLNIFKLLKLNLSDNKLKKVKVLIEGLSQNRSLVSLDLSQNPLEEKYFEALCMAISQQKIMRKLNFSEIFMTENAVLNGLRHLSELLSLKSLNLSRNDFEDFCNSHGQEEKFTVLKLSMILDCLNPGLQKLNLSNCKIGSEQFTGLNDRKFGKLKSLKELDLSMNYLGVEEFKKLLIFLHDNTSIKKLNLCNQHSFVRFTEEQLEESVKLLNQNKSLDYLDLGLNSNMFKFISPRTEEDLKDSRLSVRYLSSSEGKETQITLKGNSKEEKNKLVVDLGIYEKIPDKVITYAYPAAIKKKLSRNSLDSLSRESSSLELKANC